MDITSIILIIVFLIGMSLIANLIERKAPFLFLGICIYAIFTTNGIIKLLMIIISIKKAHELFVKTENNN